MASQVKVTPELVGCAIVTGIVAAHFIAIWWSGYPWLYCWLAEPLGGLYKAWGGVILYIAAAYIVLQVARGKFLDALGGIIIIFVIIEIPDLAAQVFGAGGSCG